MTGAFRAAKEGDNKCLHWLEVLIMSHKKCIHLQEKLSVTLVTYWQVYWATEVGPTTTENG